MPAMRAALFISAVFLMFAGAVLMLPGSRATPVGVNSMASAFSNSPAKKPDFDSEIKPIFQARCQPCHFAGGKVYDRMPFDKPETIHRLGDKLFTRIKDEKEQQRIREFLMTP